MRLSRFPIDDHHVWDIDLNEPRAAVGVITPSTISRILRSS
jgi:hypothetical protein